MFQNILFFKNIFQNTHEIHIIIYMYDNFFIKKKKERHITHLTNA